MMDFVEPSSVLHARYDINGNVILVPGSTAKAPPAKRPEAVHLQPKHGVWTTVESSPEPSPVVRERRQQKLSLSECTNVPPPLSAQETPRRDSILLATINEGSDQVTATLRSTTEGIHSLRSALTALPARACGTVHRCWRGLNTPVDFPARFRKNGKPQSKARLFIVDTIRFGGTFLGIFLVLFIGINYESFWQIAKAELAIGTDIQTEQALEHLSGGTASPVPATPEGTLLRQTDARRLVKYLPPVGPYQNRIVIPKISKNIPIVRPSMDALVQEDWKQFETDIQTALTNGVVHYPGSARPGQAGNFFLTGHSSYYPWAPGKYKNVFARLPELAIGDTYTVYYNGDKHTYRVIGKKEVLPSDVSVLDQPSDKRFATLMTCTPVGTTLRRLIVTAEEIDPVTMKVLKVGQRVIEETDANILPRLDALPI